MSLLCDGADGPGGGEGAGAGAGVTVDLWDEQGRATTLIFIDSTTPSLIVCLRVAGLDPTTDGEIVATGESDPTKVHLKRGVEAVQRAGADAKIGDKSEG